MPLSLNLQIQFSFEEIIALALRLPRDEQHYLGKLMLEKSLETEIKEIQQTVNINMPDIETVTPKNIVSNNYSYKQIDKFEIVGIFANEPSLEKFTNE